MIYNQYTKLFNEERKSNEVSFNLFLILTSVLFALAVLIKYVIANNINTFKKKKVKADKKKDIGQNTNDIYYYQNDDFEMEDAEMEDAEMEKLFIANNIVMALPLIGIFYSLYASLNYLTQTNFNKSKHEEKKKTSRALLFSSLSVISLGLSNVFVSIYNLRKIYTENYQDIIFPDVIGSSDRINVKKDQVSILKTGQTSANHFEFNDDDSLFTGIHSINLKITDHKPYYTFDTFETFETLHNNYNPFTKQEPSTDGFTMYDEPFKEKASENATTTSNVQKLISTNEANKPI